MANEWKENLGCKRCVNIATQSRKSILNNQRVELLFGGSFDPIHLGHLNLINNVRREFPNETIRLIPCFEPPLKNLTSASFEHRVAMVKLATSNIDNIIIDTRESLRPGKSYTLDTVKELKAENPDVKLIFVIGADAISSIERWYQCEKLSKYCHFLIVNRPNFDINEKQSPLEELGFSQVENYQKLAHKPIGHYSYINIDEKDISSTQIRQNLAQSDLIKHFIPNSVFDYIQKHAIYK